MYKINFSKPINVHFMGIGGISMSGLAEILLKAGFKVTGSDMKASEITDQLADMGALINIGQCASNITDNIDLVVYTAAIHPDNEEFKPQWRRTFLCSPEPSFSARSWRITNIP